MPLYNKVGVVVILVTLALFASYALTWPARDVALGGLSLALSGRILLGLLGVGLAGAGADAIVRGNPGLKPRRLRRTCLWCMLPAAVTAAAWLLLARLPDLANRAAGTVASAVALAVLIGAEYEAAGPATRWRRALGVLLHFATYAVAALLYAAAYPASRDVIAARAVGVVTAFMAFRLLGTEKLPLPRILLVSAGIGFLLGAVAWPLHARAGTAITYSLTLVIVLYMLAGLAKQFLLGKLRREVVLEYLLVGLAALVLLFFSGR